MSEILDNIYTDRFLHVAFVKYILSQIIVFGTVLFDTFWRLWNLFFKGNIFKSLLIFLPFFIRKPIISVTQAGRRKLSDPSMNNSFDVLSISLQYTLSFKWPSFGLKCLVTITLKRQSLKFKVSVWNFGISKTDRNCNSLFKLINN